MKKLLFTICIILCLKCTIIAQTQPQAPAGSGTEDDPYQIANLANLRWLSETEEAWGTSDSPVFIVQTANINAYETRDWNDGEGFSPIGHYPNIFYGRYDGQSFTISGLYINKESSNYLFIGLFGDTENAIFLNIGLVNIEYSAVVTAYNAGVNAGGIVGFDRGYVSIYNCFTTGDITSTLSRHRTRVGGIIGYGEAGEILNCFTTGNIISVAYLDAFSGGITGEFLGTISDCYSTGNITSTTLTTVSMLDIHSSSAGGIVGIGSTISNCYTTGDVTATSQSRTYAGGIAGRTNSSISFSFSQGDIYSSSEWKPSFAGGITGAGYDVFYCYSIGNITSIGDEFSGLYSNAGGIIGYIYESNIDIMISHSYSMGDIIVDNQTLNQNTHGGGIVGCWSNSNDIGSVSITNCYSTGNIITSSLYAYIGGIVGSIRNNYEGSTMSITSCFSSGNVEGTYAVGGIVGSCSGSVNISNCFSTSNITLMHSTYSTARIGGIIGSGNGAISYSYASGSISFFSGRSGGLSGSNTSISHSFWDIETTNQPFATPNFTPVGNLGLTTIEMKNESNYINSGWDFESIWKINESENNGYPTLQFHINLFQPPFNLFYIIHENYVSLAWVAPPSQGLGYLEGYKIYKNDELLDTSTMAYYEDESIDFSRENSYYVIAVYSNPEGQSMPSNTITIDPVVTINDISMPYKTALYNNYPNPFNPETRIEFSLSVASNLRVDIYNIKGQKIKTLVNDLYPTGSHSVVWNGTDDRSSSVSSGIYFYKMEAGDYVGVGKMVMMK